MYAAMLLYWGICMLAPPGAAADETSDSRAPGLELHWDAPDPSCPSEAEVAALLEPLLGDEHQRRLVVHASAREHDGHWQLTLDSESANERRQRSLSASSCQELVAALVPIVELAMVAADTPSTGPNESSPDERVDPDASEASRFEPLPAAADPPPPEIEIDIARRVRPRFALRVQSGVAFGDLPSVGPVLRLGFAGQWPHARIEVAAHHAFVRRQRWSDGTGADLRQSFAVLRGCGVAGIVSAHLEFPLCVGVEAGANHGHGVGFGDDRSGATAWFAANLGVGLAWSARENLSIGLDVEPRVAVITPAFLATPSPPQVLWAPPRFGVRALLGLELRL